MNDYNILDGLMHWKSRIIFNNQLEKSDRLLVVGGCATPVGVRYLDPKQIQRNLTANILSSDELSVSTGQILNRSNLTEEFMPTIRVAWTTNNVDFRWMYMQHSELY
jgi:hypothetical protein